MSNETQQTAVDWQFEQLFNSFESFINKGLTLDEYFSHNLKVREQAKEMENEQMRLDIEKKWEQYRIITNNEDAWSFKEWLIKQTYGGNK
jgi:hypothetical protein